MAEKFSIFALHGFTGTPSDFDFLKSFFNENATWEIPEIPPFSLEKICENFRDRWENLSGTRILLGYSMGGRIALHLAQKLTWRKNEKLILISASPGISDFSARERRKNSDEILAQKIENSKSASDFYENFWSKIPLISSQKRLPESFCARLHFERSRADLKNWAKILRLLGTGTLPSLWENLENFDVPETIFVVGEEDEKFSEIAEQMASKICRSRVLKISKSGHSPQLENALELAQRAFPREILK